MKKITTLLMLLFAATFTFGQVANEYFSPVSWWTPPRNTDFSSVDPGVSQTVIPMANALMDGNIAIDELIADDVMNIWDRIGDPNLIAGETNGNVDPFDLDANGDGTFGASWKAFYDSESLFVILKFVDTDAQSTARWFELALQTKEYERYEAGFQAASAVDTAGVGYQIMNDQYGCFVELGGMKLKFDETGVVENAMSVGATGSWGTGIGGTAVGDVATILEADGTLWYILQVAFDDLQYYVDEWAAETDNLASMDPAVETMISFEPTSRATVPVDGEDVEYAAWWNGVNNAYCSVYYQGKLEFGTTEFNPVGIGTVDPIVETRAYIYNDMLRLKGYDTAVDLEVYSIIGQKVLSAQNVSGELNVSELNDGVYIVKINNTKEAFKVLK